ncbi:MAG: class I SAM-dependent methyltransferase [Candidatus Woesebacteria bacterium]|jgi:2-polyprenyl-3-methyl-5-hydroxy-6-metoxy-1,4-benzoquinol methylase
MYDNTKTLVKYGYNQLAKANVTSRYLFDDWEHIKNLESHLYPKSKILDIGCGSGIPIDKHLIEKGHKVIGIDISEEQVELAKKNLPDGEFVVMDMENITFPKESFDAVISFYAIFHLPRSLHFDLLKNIHSLLKREGKIMITLGTKEYEKTQEEYQDIKLFWSQWGREKNLKILIDSGFDLIYEDIHTAGGEEHLIVFAKKGRREVEKETGETVYQS